MRKAFREAAEAYMSDPLVQNYYRPGTRARILRNLRTIEDDLKTLNEPVVQPDGSKLMPGPGLATAPGRIGEEHIAQLGLVWDGRGLDQSTQRKYLQDLDSFLTWVTGQPSVVTRARKLRHFRMPRAVRKSIQTLDDDDLDRLRAAAEVMASEGYHNGWRGKVARFLVEFLPATGLRPKEVLGARLADVNLGKRRVRVAHPKGEGRWASDAEAAPLPPAVHQAVIGFLADRAAYLKGESCEWLLPLRKTVPISAPDGAQVRDAEGAPLWASVLGPWTDTVLRKLAADLRERTAGPGQPGVEFSWKTMRATFGQRARDAGARIDEVSRAMRHASTKTTEEFYARVSAGAALEAVNRALSRPARREP